jgi:alpha-tubulin suppressor-like RCC1 family protein
MRLQLLQAIVLGTACATFACAQGGESDEEPLPDPRSPPLFGPVSTDIQGSPFPPSTVLQIAVSGEGTSCALLEGSQVYCWGRQIGDGTLGKLTKFPIALQPQRVDGLSDVAQIVLGLVHACVLTTKQHVLCWGLNNAAQLGTGDFEDRWAPTDVGLENIVRISTDASHVCAVRGDGAVLCWGDNSILQSYPDYKWALAHEGVLRPMAVPGITNAVDVSAGLPTCAVLMDGHVKCWGQGILYEDRDYSPKLIAGIDGALQVASAENGVMARITDGRVMAWSWSFVNEPPASSFRLRAAGPASQIQWAGSSDTFVVMNDGSVDFQRVRQPQPPFLDGTSYAPLSDVKSIAARMDDACVLKTTNVIECAGRNDAGQLGDGTKIDRRTFAPVLWPNKPIIK